MKPNAIIFDLDGLLIDSEPYWYEAERLFFKKVGLELTDEDCLLTTGMRIDKVTQYWYERRPWHLPPSPGQLAEEINAFVIEAICTRAELLPGAREAIQLAHGLGLPVGLASSSHLNLIEAALDAFDLRRYFHSVASSEQSGYSKPHPGVYLLAADRLGVEPDSCLAVEDSVNGLIAAKAARMKCLVIPGHGLEDDPRFVLADARLGSLLQFESVLLK